MKLSFLYLFLLLLYASVASSSFYNGLCKSVIITTTPIASGGVCGSVGGQLITLTAFNSSASLINCNQTFNATSANCTCTSSGTSANITIAGGNDIIVTQTNATSFRVDFSGALSYQGTGHSLIQNASTLELAGLEAGNGTSITASGKDLVIASNIQFGTSGAGDASQIQSATSYSLTLREPASLIPHFYITGIGGSIVFSSDVICSDGRPSMLFGGVAYCNIFENVTNYSASCNNGTLYTLYGNNTLLKSVCAAPYPTSSSSSYTVNATADGIPPISSTSSTHTTLKSFANTSTVQFSTTSTAISANVSPNLTLNTVTTGTLTETGGILFSTTTGITAAGADQAGATALTTTSLSVVSTVAASTGVRLPTAVIGMRITVRNTGANTLNVYPATGAAIGTAGTNVAVNIVAGASATYAATSTTQWYTIAFPVVAGSLISVVYSGNGQVTISGTAPTTSPLLYSNTGVLTQNNPGANVFVTMIPSGSGTLTVPADILVAGSKVCYVLTGFFSVTGSTSGSFRLRMDGATIYTSIAGGNIGAATNGRLSSEGSWNIFTSGTSGTMLGSGYIQVSDTSYTLGSTTPVAYNTSSAHTFDIQFAYSGANAANTFTVTSFRLWIAKT